ncbi:MULTISPECIES: hypothetical protein [unclassified Gordonia (in: high G+C Gram-positive bacteria)]
MAAFSDDDLDEFYRRIEHRTSLRATPRSRPTKPTPGVCPTPDKDAFDTVSAADAAAARIRALRATAPRLRSYECVCGAWHITSSPDLARPAADRPDPGRRRRRR